MLALTAITGMRSTAGVAALAAQRGGFARGATAVMALGELIADKTAVVGNRTDAGPQAARALMGALIGGLVAREDGEPAWLGALVGAGTAVAATHLTYHWRTRGPLPVTLAGFMEDAVVIGVGTRYARRDGRRA
ncbi:MAG TPA: hypothetical protein VF159_08670 [Gemmatimonadaceae bacterium]